MLPNSADYWSRIRTRAVEIESDGCTGVPDFYLDACLEHDVHYHDGRRIDGVPITQAWADRRFRQRIQSRSMLGVLHPMSWWRWAGVRIFGRRAWTQHRERERIIRAILRLLPDGGPPGTKPRTASVHHATGEGLGSMAG